MMNGKDESSHRGRPIKYVTMQIFQKFITNDFWHLQRNVRVLMWINGTILGSIIVWALIDRLLS